jgi:hypothetical protein
MEDWHHYFELSWKDFFRDTAVEVEAEKDLSEQQQFLDLLLVRPEGGPLPPRPLPDGFDDLGRFNLITFKSHQEALDGEAMDELVGHSMRLRKLVSPNAKNLLPLTDFRRFAVCVRSPRKLAQETGLQRLGNGVYEARHFSGVIRVVVIHELPRQPHNAMLLGFSAQREIVEYAAQHYRPHSPETSSLLLQMINRYRQEGILMSETLEEFVRRTREEVLKSMPPEELRKRLSPEERLEGVPAEELRKRLSPKERVEGLSPEERVEGLSPEQLETLARRLRETLGQPPQG